MHHKDIFIFSTDLINWLMNTMDDDEIASAIASDMTEKDHGPSVTDPECWYRVAWPEHVLTPRFNSDASYHRVNAGEIPAGAVVHADSVSRVAQ